MPNIDTVADWSRVFRDVAVWRPLVLAVLRRHQLADCYACLDIQPGRVAGTHAVFIVDQDLVIKLYGPFWPEDQSQELAALRLLGRQPRALGEVRVPHLLFSGVLDARANGSGGQPWPYAVLEFLPGVQLGDIWPSLTGGQRNHLAGQLGSLLANLHGTPIDSHEGIQRARDWLTFIETQTATAQERHRSWHSLPGHLIDDLPGFLQSTRPLPRPDWRPALLHCDVTAEHVLLRRHEDRRDKADEWLVSGLIDFGDARIGDPEYDFLAVFLSALAMDHLAFKALLKAYGHPLEDGSQLGHRLLAYMLLHVFPVLKDLPQDKRHRLWSATSLEMAASTIWAPA